MTGLGAYKEMQAQAETQEQVVERYAPLVKRIAYHLVSRLPSSVQADDLIQSGMIGLLEAAQNYDPSRGASFETYGGIRIRGAMLDEIRKSDWAPRSLHRKMREVSQAIHGIEMREGRDARDSEVSDVLDISLDDYHRILRDAAGHKIFSFDELASTSESVKEARAEGPTGPLDALEFAQFREALARAIASLPERERLVMSLYYDEELNLRETGEVLNVSESRVCQIHSQALLRVKARMSEWRKDQ